MNKGWLFIDQSESRRFFQEHYFHGKVAVVTMARNDAFFLIRWVAYYGREFGWENLYIILDGEDQVLPEEIQQRDIHILNLPHKTMSRAEGDKYRISLINKVKNELLESGYEGVIGVDADEFIVVDPQLDQSLLQYILEQKNRGVLSLSALGLDLAENQREETDLNPSLSLLEQRRYAVLSSRYTKSSILFSTSLRWGSGFHRVKGHRYHIAPHLFLIHAGYCSSDLIGARSKDYDRIDAGWQRHIFRRCRSIRYASQKRVFEGDVFFKKARFLQQIFHPLQAWNKPLMPTPAIVVKLPERFKQIHI